MHHAPQPCAQQVEGGLRTRSFVQVDDSIKLVRQGGVEVVRLALGPGAVDDANGALQQWACGWLAGMGEGGGGQARCRRKNGWEGRG